MVREAGKPRGKTSPYGFFVKMCYEEHKKKYPNEKRTSDGDLEKCSEKWKTMSQAEKQRFFELAQKDAERYQIEIQAFGGEDAMRKRKRAKKDPNAPKRALSAFFFFSQVKRQGVSQGHPEWKVGSVAQELGRQWKDLTETEKKKYEEMAQRDKGRYEIEMRDYKASTGQPAKKSRGGGGGGGGAAAAAAAASTSAPSASVEEEPEDDDEDDEVDEDD